jgi:regulator of protease activity HflC (stomatin/prohibitin superfamily)
MVRFEKYGQLFVEAKSQMHEKDTLSDLFDDTELKSWVAALSQDPSGFSKLRHAPEALISDGVSQELRTVIMEGLLSEAVTGEEQQLMALLKRGIYRSWARFSHTLKSAMADADARQDMEKFRELSQQFLDLQRKLKDFEDSYVTGKND